MKEQYERALKALADKMEQLRDEPEKVNRFAVCSSMERVAKCMAKLGKIAIALDHSERMDNDAKETIDMLLRDMVRKDET